VSALLFVTAGWITIASAPEGEVKYGVSTRGSGERPIATRRRNEAGLRAFPDPGTRTYGSGVVIAGPCLEPATSCVQLLT
jgi:hypothetical protein